MNLMEFGLPYSLTDGAFKPLKKEGKFEMIMNRPYEKIAFRAASGGPPQRHLWKQDH